MIFKLDLLFFIIIFVNLECFVSNHIKLCPHSFKGRPRPPSDISKNCLYNKEENTCHCNFDGFRGNVISKGKKVVRKVMCEPYGPTDPDGRRSGRCCHCEEDCGEFCQCPNHDKRGNVNSKPKVVVRPPKSHKDGCTECCNNFLPEPEFPFPLWPRITIPFPKK